MDDPLSSDDEMPEFELDEDTKWLMELGDVLAAVAKRSNLSWSLTSGYRCEPCQVSLFGREDFEAHLAGHA